MKFLRFLLLCFLGIGFSESVAAWTESANWQNDKLQLNVYAQDTGRTSENLQVLVKFRMINGWHISWDNPGDAGTPVQFDWRLPEGWRAEKLNSSTPQKFIYNDIVSQYGYGGTAYYLFEISAPKSQTEDLPDLTLHVRWTACRDICEPEQAVLKISETAPADWAEQLSAAQKTFPETAAAPAYAQNINGTLKIVFPDGSFDLKTEPFYFIPYERRLIPADAPQAKLLNQNNRLEIQVEAEHYDFIPTGGVLIYGKKAYAYSVVPINESLPQKNAWSPWALLLFAFAGGLILNCMPCVFPVLSLKAVSMAQSARQDGHIRRGFCYLAGVLSCFGLIAFLLYLLRRTGDVAGWGFQLQSPLFVGIMLVVFLLLFLMMADIVKIRGNRLDAINRFAGLNSFMTGFFAVLIASPCTGPFMGAALGYALFQPPYIYFPFFLSLGLGYALPFALAEMYPAVIRKILPKPGKWTDILKKILSIPVLLTCLWLSWILYHQITTPAQPTENDLWQPYDERLTAKQVEAGNAVFIDFTAKWCITCLANEKLVLDTKAFADFAKKNNIVLFKADWTAENPDITRALDRFGRAGVPLYVYYPPQKRKGQNNTFIILPQLLTFDIVQKYLNTQNQNND